MPAIRHKCFKPLAYQTHRVISNSLAYFCQKMEAVFASASSTIENIPRLHNKVKAHINMQIESAAVLHYLPLSMNVYF